MADKIREKDVVVLIKDIPERRLSRGEVGTIVEIVAASQADSGHLLVEFENGTQADFDDTADLLKVTFLHLLTAADDKPTLEKWAGKSQMFALVFTDIVGSTSIANELRDERWIDLLQTHFGQARRLMAQYDHHEIKIIGDSFMVAFHTASDALDFALDLYEDTGDDRVKIRAGIHVGSATIVEDDMFGIMVNYTKRVESTNNPSGIHVSNFAKTEIDNRGRHGGLRFRENELEFKGFPKLQKVWRVFDPRWFLSKAHRPPQNRAGIRS